MRGALVPTAIKHRPSVPYRKNPFSVATLFGEFDTSCEGKNNRHSQPPSHANTKSSLMIFDDTCHRNLHHRRKDIQGLWTEGFSPKIPSSPRVEPEPCIKDRINEGISTGILLYPLYDIYNRIPHIYHVSTRSKTILGLSKMVGVIPMSSRDSGSWG